MLCYYAYIPVDLVIPEGEFRPLAQVLGLIDESASKAAPVKLLKANYIKIPYQPCDAPQVLKHLGVRQYVPPAAGEVMVIPTRGNPHMYVVAQKLKFARARPVIAIELEDTS